MPEIIPKLTPSKYFLPFHGNVAFGPTVILVITTEDHQRHHPDRLHIIVQLETHNKVGI